MFQPTQPTSFVGRRDELAEITSQVTEPRCRLLTLVGVGGVGKTRLALEAATQVADQFADGVRLVALQSVDPDNLLSALADALNLSLSGQDAPETQVLAHLRDKELLLLLDNFEHLLARVALLPTILEHAPGVTLLVTSREALNLQEEWRFPVRGLPHPPRDDSDDLEAYGAVQLFVERARRVAPSFSLAAQRDAVRRICHLVEGMPLALELAASWTKALRASEIADEIEHNLHFLATRLRNVPDRHRNMQAVFDHSWSHLSDEERNVFKRLSVFRGGFRRNAARVVAGASLPVLSALVDKSLLRYGQDGRYQIHELLRQYATEKLAHTASEAVTTRERHGSYYLAFLAERTDGISGGRQLEAATEIAAELDNVRAAWQWAVEQKKSTLLTDAAFALYYFCQFGSRYLEGMEMSAQAAALLDDETLSAQPEAMLLLTGLGWFHVRLGRFEEAQDAFARAYAVYRRFDDLPAMPYANDPSLGLGLLATMRGAHDEAKRLLQQGIDRSEQHGYLLNEETGHYVLAGIHLAQGRHAAAQRHARAAYAAAQALQDRWFMAYCRIELGNVAAALGDYEAATTHFEASYAIREEFDDAEGMAVALTHQGDVALQQADVVKAQRLFQESLDIYLGISDKGGLATALHGLGQTALAREDVATARQTLRHALRIADEIQFIPLLLDIIVSTAELVLESGPASAALTWLEVVQQHPTADHGVRSRAEAVRAPFEADDSAPPGTQTLTEVVADVQATLAVEPETPGIEDAAETTAPSPLIEPLTEREREVLHLLAQGLTNREIADQLIIAVGTVKSHNHHIYGKLGVKNRAEAVARAMKLELL